MHRLWHIRHLLAIWLFWCLILSTRINIKLPRFFCQRSSCHLLAFTLLINRVLFQPIMSTYWSCHCLSKEYWSSRYPCRWLVAHCLMFTATQHTLIHWEETLVWHLCLAWWIALFSHVQQSWWIRWVHSESGFTYKAGLMPLSSLFSVISRCHFVSNHFPRILDDADGHRDFCASINITIASHHHWHQH